MGPARFAAPAPVMCGNGDAQHLYQVLSWTTRPFERGTEAITPRTRWEGFKVLDSSPARAPFSRLSALGSRLSALGSRLRLDGDTGILCSGRQVHRGRPRARCRKALNRLSVSSTRPADAGRDASYRRTGRTDVALGGDTW